MVIGMRLPNKIGMSLAYGLLWLIANVPKRRKAPFGACLIEVAAVHLANWWRPTYLAWSFSNSVL